VIVRVPEKKWEAPTTPDESAERGTLNAEVK
jgi:hypothetical protein